MAWIRIAAALAAGGMAGCGYRFGVISDHREIAFAIFDNVTEHRYYEAEFSRQLLRELAHAGIRVSSDAPVELRGNIVDVTFPVLAESQTDEVLVGAFAMSVRLRLVERATGRTLWEETASARSSFTDLRSKPVEAARQEVFRELGARIASKLDSEW